MTTPAEALEAAARESLHAPSVFNTQPWHWRISGDTMTLTADRTRALGAADPDGRLLLLSCGTALHHARLALSAAGWQTTVEHFPEPDVPARITLTGHQPADPATRRLAEAIDVRRTDRRAYADEPVSDTVLAGLRQAVEAQGAYLHVVRPDQLAMLAVSTELAGRAESRDPAYRAELKEWTSRPAGAGDGVPVATAVRPALRRVPVRDFAPEGGAGLSAGEEHDAGAAYVIVFGLGDSETDLVRGGEALSALLLTATAEGLATAPISDTVEVEWSRHLLRGLLADVGEPYVAVRVGHPGQAGEVPPAPRRDAGDVIESDG
jgi:hypothetical protein